MLPNCSGVLRRPRVFDAELEGAGGLHGRLVEHAGGDLGVFGLEGGDDLAGGEAAGGDLFGVEPDAHGVVAGADDVDVADAGCAGEDVLDLQGGVVGEVELVARVLRRVEVHDHHEVGARLS